jgi:hypothetical protein
MHAVWVALGYEEPTLMERVAAGLHRAKVAVGLEQPTNAEKVEAAIDAAGEATVSMFQRVKDAVAGA